MISSSLMKNGLLRSRDYIFPLNWTRALKLSLSFKLPLKKIGALKQIKFFLSDIPFHLYKSTIRRPCVE